MRRQRRSVIAVAANLVSPKAHGIFMIASDSDINHPTVEEERVDATTKMSQLNGMGVQREQTPINTNVVPPGRVISTSMMRQATVDQTPPPETTPWSSAVGHASTGKSGRVIERLQQEIDRLNREKQLLKLRHEEAERATETLNTRNQYLQDRNSNYESSHEANLRQLQRKERQVEDLKEELQKERLKTSRAEDAARTAAIREEEWKEQANHAKAIAQQKETEYNAIASCRTIDNERHQTGLDKIRTHLATLVQQREEDQQKQKRIEIIAEQQKQTIEQLEELTKKLTNNFRLYRNEIDAAIDDVRNAANDNDDVVSRKLEEMRKVTGEMRWVVNIETMINGKQVPQRPSELYDTTSEAQSFNTAQSTEASVEDFPKPPSPSKKLSLDFRKHRRKGSKAAK